METKFHVWDGKVFNSNPEAELLGVMRNLYDFWEAAQRNVCFPATGGPVDTETGEGNSDHIFNDGILVTEGLNAGIRHFQEEENAF